MKKIIVLLFICISLLVTGCSVKKVEKMTDSERFAKEYNISSKNSFKYAKYDEIIDILDNKKAIILLADSDEETSIKAVEIINKVAKKNNIEKIYYYNPKTLKEKKQKKYKRLIKLIESKIEDYKVTYPTLYAVSLGKVINYCNYFSKKEELSEEYLTKKKLKKIEKKYLDVLTYQLDEEDKKKENKEE